MDKLIRHQTRVHVYRIYPDQNLVGYGTDGMRGTLAADLEENYPMVIYEDDPTESGRLPGSGIVTSRITGLVTGRDGSIYVHTRNSIYRLEILD